VLLRPRRENRGHVRDVRRGWWTAVARLMRSGRDDDVSELRHVFAVEGSFEERIPERKKALDQREHGSSTGLTYQRNSCRRREYDEDEASVSRSRTAQSTYRIREDRQLTRCKFPIFSILFATLKLVKAISSFPCNLFNMTSYNPLV